MVVDSLYDRYSKFSDKVSFQQVDHSCLSPSHDPTEPVLAGNGCVIVLKGGQGETSVCVQAAVHPSSRSSFCDMG